MSTRNKGTVDRRCSRPARRSARAAWPEVELLVFLDAVHVPTRPSRAKQGVLVA
jgi:hypothetical protein